MFSRPLRSLLVFALTAPSALCQSDRAYPLLDELASENRRFFFVYKDHDAGVDKAYPSGFFPSDLKLKTDPACVDDPENTLTGCASDQRRLDCQNGTVFRLTWSPMSPLEYYGLNFEEPENFGSRPRGTGYDLRPATDLVLRYRSPTGVSVQFGVNQGGVGFETQFLQIPPSRTWTEKRIALADLRATDPSLRIDLRNVQIPFFVVTNGSNAPNGGTLLLDDIRFEPVPARQDSVPSFPLANRTCGVIPAADKLSGRVAIPPDQVIRNLTTTYESSLVLWALLRRGTKEDLENAKFLADAFVYAVGHDNTGFPLPKTSDGAGLRNAYINGDLPFANDQQCPGSWNCPPSNVGSGAKKGEPRLAGFGISSNLCGDSKFCLVLDGATGGNNAFAVIATLAAYRQFGDSRYLSAARSAANWIHGMLLDPDPDGFGGYFAGLPDEGQEKKVIQGKSVENNADIAAAFQMLSEVESELCNRAQAETWASRSRVAADFVMRMFDPVSGRFFAGTVLAGAQASAGIKPDGERRGREVINTWDFLDANTFVPLALTSLPRYGSAIDWRRPVEWASKQVQRIRAAGQSFEGFNIVQSPVSGPTGIAWEFTGQMVVTMRVIDALYGETRFRPLADGYLAQIQRAQVSAPFADGRGLVASTMDGGDQVPAYEQCLSTPFQCIAQRVGLAATLWAIFAENSLNPLGRGAISLGSLPSYVNAASFNGCLSPGGLFSRFQPGASDQSGIASGFPLPLTLGGAQVRIGGRLAPLLYVGPDQIYGQVPYEVLPGKTDAELIAGSASRSTSTVQIAPVSPGIFLLYDGRRCIARNSSGTLNSTLNPTESRGGVTVYLTGLGSVQPPIETGAPAPREPPSHVNASAVATIGGRPAGIRYLGLTPDTAGVGEANLEPDQGLAPGDQEVSIELDGIPSNKCIVSVGPDNGYPAPWISSVTPNNGLTRGGTKVTVRGGGFWASGMTVHFGTTLAREVVPLDPSALMAFAPAGIGVVSITLTTPDNRSAVADRAFTYRQPAPTLASISPSAGPTSGGTQVTLKGADLQAGAAVRFGNSAAASVLGRDEQTIEATSPAGAAGVVNVTVVNPDGQSASLPNGFTYKAPLATNPSISAHLMGCQILGSVAGVDPPNGFRVVLYARTTQFYIQPCSTEPTQSISSNGAWGPVDSHDGDVFALIVRPEYDPPAVTESLLVVDRVNVFAVVGPVGRLSGCDVARCMAR